MRATRPSPASAAGSTTRPRPLLARLAVLVPLLGLVLAGSRAAQVAVAAAPALAQLVVGLALAAGAAALYRAVVGRWERRRVDELDPATAAGGLARGALVGLVASSATIALIAVLGGYRVTGWGSVGAVVAAVGAASATAVDEELLFRGVVFRVAEERLGSWGALVLSALLFAALHLVNPHATAWGAAALAVEAGGMLAAAHLATRGLWLPIGIHAAWNLAEGAIWGTTVSGSTDGAPASLVTSVLHGPPALTGAGFGPEASVPAVLVCLVPTVLLLRLAHRRGTIRSRAAVRASRPAAG